MELHKLLVQFIDSSISVGHWLFLKIIYLWSFNDQGIKLFGAELEMTPGSASSTREICLETLNLPLVALLIK